MTIASSLAVPTLGGHAPHRRRTAVLLHAPQGGPAPRERRQTADATPGWHWTCVVMRDDRLDLLADPVLVERLRSADLVLCAEDRLRAAVVACGIPAAAVTGTWPAADRWAALLDDLHVVASC